jgi:hypothetical protein
MTAAFFFLSVLVYAVGQTIRVYRVQATVDASRETSVELNKLHSDVLDVRKAVEIFMNDTHDEVLKVTVEQARVNNLIKNLVQRRTQFGRSAGE